MQALITGGAGFIGSNIAAGLTSMGWRVRVLDDLSSGYRCNLDDLDVDFRQGDVRDAQAVAAAADGCGVLFHLAESVGNKRSIEIGFGPRRAGDVKNGRTSIGAASATFGYRPQVTMADRLPLCLRWGDQEAARTRDCEGN